MEDSEEIRALEEFVLNNPDMEKLEEMLDIFNVFEVLKIEKVELKHSDFLAWLFNPYENHSLESFFLRQFLKRFYSENKGIIDSDLTLFDFETFDYSDVEIRREWRNIDILILIRGEGKKNKKVAIAIENKIDSPETNDQLVRYKKIMGNEFPDYNRLLIFLTPYGIEPSDSDWIPFQYGAIAELLEGILEHKKDYLSDNVYNFIDQYKRILRRYIVEKGEIEEICRKIYTKHQRALDLIFEYRPDLESQISDYLNEMISKYNLIKYSSSKTYTAFSTDVIDKKIEKTGLSDYKNLFYYEVINRPKKLQLMLRIGPGNKDIREKLYNFCIMKPDLFNVSNRSLSPKYHAVVSKTLLSTNDYGEGDVELLKSRMENNFEKFFNNEMKEIDRYFEEKWTDNNISFPVKSK